MQQDWKNALLGTLSDAERETIARKREAEQSAVPKCGVQHFTVELDKRQKGKVATLVTGYMGSEDDLKIIAEILTGNS